MKFLSLAVAALVGLVEGKKKISGSELQSRMLKGQFNKQSLMRGAKPYGEKTIRRLEEAEEEWEISGLYSVQFSSCFSMTVQDEDLFDENFINDAQNGNIVAEKSYILFTACLSDECYYQADDQKLTFITDIASFFNAFADFLPNQVEQYCEGCNQNYDYCMGNLDAGDDAAAEDDQAEEAQEGQEEEQEDAQEEEQGAEQQEENQDNEQEEQQDEQQKEGEDQEGEENNENRRLAKVAAELPFRRLQNGQVVQMIDCDMCAAYECFEDENEQQQQADDGEESYEFEDALEWLDALSQCQQMDLENGNYNYDALYAGLICNSDGNGVEIGVFMDQNCMLYAPKLSFGNMMNYADSQYFSMSQEVVEYMFTNDFSCYQPDIQYTNPYEYVEDDDQANQQDENQEDPEAAEWCRNLFDGDMNAVSLYDCGVQQNDDANNNNNNNNQDDQYDEYLDTYEWYSYKLTQEQADDASEVCQVFKGWNGKKTTVYDKKNSGTLYNYQKNWGANNGNGMRPGGVATLVLFIVVVAGAVAAFVMKNKSTNDKKTPLISTAEGTMA